MIGVVDYGIGNLRSVMNALVFLELEAELVADPAAAERAERLILPGVGAFGAGMRRLDERGFTEALPGLVASGRPILGICLGMQLLAEASEEHGEHPGLGLVEGRVVRLEVAPLRVPHVGWNTIRVRNETPLLAGLGEEPTFYFVHSYELRPAAPSAIAATADYGGEVTAVTVSGAAFGAQFHPEKSQAAGLRLLRNFAAL